MGFELTTLVVIGVKKFNTVAYRGDKRPDKWKRASFNGHLYSYEVIVV
jgi:hypothetical protein